MTRPKNKSQSFKSGRQKGVSPKKLKKENFIKISSSYTEVYHFLQKHCSCPTFTEDHWYTSLNDIQVLEPRKRHLYIPKVIKSSKFKHVLHQNIGEAAERNWTSLDVFEVSENAEASSFTAFIGSHSYAMDWVPLPWQWETGNSFDHDYLLIASLGGENVFNDYEIPNYAEKQAGEQPCLRGLLQLWRFDVTNRNLKLSCCFAHDFGLAWCIEFCKGGTSYDHNRNRLGLAAVAFADGFIRIFSIPIPENLPSTKLFPSIFRLSPVAILEPPFSKHFLCRTLSWSWCDKQAFLAAGYGNGFISLFQPMIKSVLLKKDSNNPCQIIKSIRTWFAHGAIVTSLQILPLSKSNLIVSGGFDRSIKLWNTSEPRLLPLSLLYRSVVNCLHSSIHWPTGFFISLDDCFLCSNQSIVSYKQLVCEGQRTLSDPRSLYSMPWDASNVYSVCLSTFHNSLIISDNSGNVVLVNNFRAKHEKSIRRKQTELLPIFITHLERLFPEDSRNNDTSTESDQNSTVEDGYLISKQKPRERSYEEMVSHYGLVFADFSLDLEDAGAFSDLNTFRQKPDAKKCRLTDYPITCINKCIWSPNKKSSTCMANLMHSGFLRLSCLPPNCCKFSGGEDSKTEG